MRLRARGLAYVAMITAPGLALTGCFPSRSSLDAREARSGWKRRRRTSASLKPSTASHSLSAANDSSLSRIGDLHRRLEAPSLDREVAEAVQSGR